MPSNGAGLQVENLSKEYPTPTDPLVVLRNVSFTLEPGEALAVMGPSGSGKSSLLYILGALEKPTSGSVRVAGEDPFQLGAEALAAFRNRKVGFIFQDHHLLPQCSALENVLIPTLAGGARQAPSQAAERAAGLLERVGLSARAAHRPAELSGGERQRVAIARALMQRPALLLADEPTGNLDRRTADAVAELLLELQREEGSVLALVTHSAELAARFARRAELTDGSLEQL
jgi:lipoprotein-releasing system ATP-binding protein